MGETILRQISVLNKLSGLELRERYCQIFGVEVAPNSNKPFLIRQLAFRLQELSTKRTLSETAGVRMRSLLGDNGFDPETGKPARGQRGRDGRTVQVSPGTVVDREFHGQVYRVTALPRGKWEYERRVYESLSKIAREITGTSRSGPQFFGLVTAGLSGQGKKR